MIEIPDAYRNETIARQLGALAATLARVSSCARRPARAAAVVPLLTECMTFVEWTAPRASVEVAAELHDLQVMLALWRQAWPGSQASLPHRTLLSFQAKKWSDLTVDWSGILDKP